MVTEALPAFRSCRASSRRSSFWYCSGVVEVMVLKCWWNDDALMPTRRARSGIAMGERMSSRMWPMARAMALAWLSWRISVRSIPPNGAVRLLSDLSRRVASRCRAGDFKLRPAALKTRGAFAPYGSKRGRLCRFDEETDKAATNK